MMKYALLAVMACMSLMAGCGGGGGASSPTTAKLVLQTSGTIPAGTSMVGIGISVVLPGGVTPKKDGSGNLDASVVTASGVTVGAATVVSNYTEATSSSPGKITFVLASTLPNGFGTGEFATVTVPLSGTSPLAGDFTLTGFTPVDQNGATIPTGAGGLQATFGYSVQ